MTNTEAYNVLDDGWHALDARMDDLIAAAKTRQQGESLVGSWKQAGANAIALRDAIFTTDDATLVGLVADTGAAQAAFETDLAQLQTIAADLDRFNGLVVGIAHAVALGTEVVTAVAAL